jgi:hypothetical protein
MEFLTSLTLTDPRTKRTSADQGPKQWPDGTYLFRAKEFCYGYVDDSRLRG